AVDITNAGLTAFNVTLSDANRPAPTPNTLAISGSTLYLGGQWTHVGGLSRTGFAEISLSTTGVVSSWNPVASFTNGTGASNVFINSSAIVGTNIYVAGNFERIGLNDRPGAAAFSL